MEFVVLQARSENRAGIQQAVLRKRGTGGFANPIHYHSDIVGTQIEVMRLNNNGSNICVISGLGISERFMWSDLSKVMKRISPNSLFLVFTQFPLHEFETTPSMDGVIPRMSLDASGNEFDVIGELLTTRFPRGCTIQQMKILVSQLILVKELPTKRT